MGKRVEMMEKKRRGRQSRSREGEAKRDVVGAFVGSSRNTITNDEGNIHSFECFNKLFTVVLESPNYAQKGSGTCRSSSSSSDGRFVGALVGFVVSQSVAQVRWKNGIRMVITVLPFVATTVSLISNVHDDGRRGRTTSVTRFE